MKTSNFEDAHTGNHSTARADGREREARFFRLFALLLHKQLGVLLVSRGEVTITPQSAS